MTTSMTVLPPVESTVLILMRFTKKASPSLIHLVKERLTEGGLHIVVEEIDEDDPNNTPVLLGLTVHQPDLETEAQHIRLLKRTMDETNIMDFFQVSERHKYCNTNPDLPRDSHGLFNANDRVLLAWKMLDEIDVLPKGQMSSNLSRLLDAQKIVYRRKLTAASSIGEAVLVADSGDSSYCLRQVLQTHDLCDVFTPCHIPTIRDAIWKQTLYNLSPPVDAIRDYYGEEVAFYFAWMGFFTRWLCFPAFLGVIVYIFRKYRNETVDDDEYTAFYGLVCFLWAILFERFWQRHEHRLAYSWGTSFLSDYQTKSFAKRPEFIGKLRQSPVTGQLETYYPAYKRRLKYAVSALVTTSLLTVAFVIMILSLNLQGYIHPESDPERWTDDHHHPFHYPFFSILADEGHVFDAKSLWRCYLPVIVHVCCIFSLNLLYRRVAELLTEWENHETDLAHRNSLILKRFLFEAFDCYMALFYLAFYERDVHRLRLELVSVFTIDTFRRLALECILPMIKQRLQHPPHTGAHKKDDDNHTTLPRSSYSPLASEANRDEYEQFDDYMEIVIQLGYMTLFASAFPLASLIAILANLTEIRSDCFKLTFLCRRPRSIRSDGLGMWKTLISSIIWLSALTNCLIFGFTSDQLMQFLPNFYYMDSQGHTKLAPTKGWLVIFVIFGLERALVYTALLLRAIVPKVPEDVMDELERRHWVHEQESKQWKKKDRQLRGSIQKQ